MFAWSSTAHAYVMTVVTVAFTNTIWGTSNYNTLTVNGDTRTFTNQVYNSATQILTNSTQAGSAANLFNHILAAPFTGVGLSQSSSTNIVLLSGKDAALSVSVSSGWATTASATFTYGVSNIPVIIPHSFYTLAEQTNIISDLFAWFNSGQSTNPLSVSISSTNNTTHFRLDVTNDVTHSDITSTNDTTLWTNAPNGDWLLASDGSLFGTNRALGWWFTITNNLLQISNAVTGKGFIATNGNVTADGTITAGSAIYADGFFGTTNAINSGTLQAGRNYETNLTGNITLGLISAIPNNRTWAIWLFATNSTSTDHTVTGMEGTKEQGNAPFVFTITNQQCADIIIYGWGNKKTNVAYYPHGY